VVANDILDFTKIESGTTQLHFQEISTLLPIENALNALNHKFRQKNLEFFLKISPLVPKEIQTDPHSLTRILLNLLSNSVKVEKILILFILTLFCFAQFTEKGYVMIYVSAEDFRDSQCCTLTIQVVDTGIGISDEAKNILFQPFVQGRQKNHHQIKF
jgi:signal transduction histidine kinase